MTALHIASCDGQFEIVKILLTYGADLHDKTYYRVSNKNNVMATCYYNYYD